LWTLSDPDRTTSKRSSLLYFACVLHYLYKETCKPGTSGCA
jgi:hypothetical protein